MSISTVLNQWHDFHEHFYKQAEANIMQEQCSYTQNKQKCNRECFVFFLTVQSQTFPNTILTKGFCAVIVNMYKLVSMFKKGLEVIYGKI